MPRICPLPTISQPNHTQKVTQTKSTQCDRQPPQFKDIRPYEQEKPVKAGFKLGKLDVKVWSTSHADIGHCNQDSLSIFAIDDHLFFCICDGVSGNLETPEATARYVALFLASFKDAVHMTIMKGVQTESFDAFVFENISIALTHVSETAPELATESCTFSCVMVNNHTLRLDYFVLGDSGLLICDNDGTISHHIPGTQSSLFDLDTFMSNCPMQLAKTHGTPAPNQLFAGHKHAYLQNIERPFEMCPPFATGTHQLNLWDRIVLATDGLWDNADKKNIAYNCHLRSLALTPMHKANIRQFWTEWFKSQFTNYNHLPLCYWQEFYEKMAQFMHTVDQYPNEIKPDDTSFIHIRVASHFQQVPTHNVSPLPWTCATVLPGCH